MTRRQPKLPLTLRIIAAGSVAFWLAAVSACSIEALLCCDSDDDQTVEHAKHEHSPDGAAAETDHAEAHRWDDAEPNHSEDSKGHSHGSHKHDGREGSCCSTLHATPPNAKLITFSIPAGAQDVPLCPLLETGISGLNAPDNVSDRPPPSAEWASTPEVCTGLANRAHAPPLCV